MQPSVTHQPQATCAAITSTGAKCQRRAGPDATYCWQHAWRNAHGLRAKLRSLSKNAPILFALAATSLVVGVAALAITLLAWEFPQFWNKPQSRLEVTDVVGVQAKSGNRFGFFFNVFYTNKGTLPVTSMAHRSIVVSTETMTREEEEHYKQLAKSISPPPPQPGYEIQPGSPPKHYFSAPEDDAEIAQLGAVVPDVLSGRKRMYVFVVMKYQDEALSKTHTRVTEFCGWFSGTLDIWHNCGGRIYVTPPE